MPPLRSSSASLPSSKRSQTTFHSLRAIDSTLNSQCRRSPAWTCGASQESHLLYHRYPQQIQPLLERPRRQITQRQPAVPCRLVRRLKHGAVLEEPVEARCELVNVCAQPVRLEALRDRVHHAW